MPNMPTLPFEKGWPRRASRSRPRRRSCSISRYSYGIRRPSLSPVPPNVDGRDDRRNPALDEIRVGGSCVRDPRSCGTEGTGHRVPLPQRRRRACTGPRTGARRLASRSAPGRCGSSTAAPGTQPRSHPARASIVSHGSHARARRIGDPPRFVFDYPFRLAEVVLGDGGAAFAPGDSRRRSDSRYPLSTFRSPDDRRPG